MQIILSAAIIAILCASLIIALRWGHLRCTGKLPVSLFTFNAILFTSGLDVGLIMFPLTEFPLLETEAVYAFANPLAIEFGFWGFLVWGLYFLTTFYFCIVEPRLKLFEISALKVINNMVIIATCAFTGYLLLQYLPSYIANISEPMRFGLVMLVVLLATLSSTDIRCVKILSLSSTWLFFILITLMWLHVDMGLGGMAAMLVQIGEYFTHLHYFITPMSEIHAFYLFWWLSWSIMIGQFVARFVGGIKTWQLFLSLLLIPSIPIALWFSVLYYYHVGELEITGFYSQAMIIIGILFVLNSIDSLTRLYTTNLNITVERFGKRHYILANWLLLVSLILLYQFTPLKIEWVGLIVIGIYLTVFCLFLMRRNAG